MLVKGTLAMLLSGEQTPGCLSETRAVFNVDRFCQPGNHNPKGMFTKHLKEQKNEPKLEID